MSVIRRGPLAADNFTIVSNKIIRDARLSLKARGLGIWLLSHTEGWKLSIRSIATQVGAGAEAVQSGLKELEDAGYLIREQQTGEHGKFTGVEYRISDVPAGETASGFSVHGSPGDGEAGARETGTHKKTNSKKINKQEDQTPAAAASEALFEVPEQREEDAPAKPLTINQRANALAGQHYERLGKMGNVPAFAKIIKQALTHDWPDKAVDDALAYIAEHNWTLTAERLANTLRGGPKPPARPAPARPSNAARVVGNQRLEF
jgi:hypothetical protein